MRKILPFAAAVAVLGFAHPAHATLLDIGLGLTSSDVAYTFGGALNPDTDISTTPNLVLNHNAAIINPPSATVINYYIKPSGPIYDGSFLTVYGQSGPNFVSNPGTATFTLIPNQNAIGFTWGTIDDYNYVTLTDSRGVQYTITGADILANIAGSINHTSQNDVKFNDPNGTIVSAVFGTYGNSFEIANIQDAPLSGVPLPAGLPLFGSALMGLALVSWMKARRA